MSDDPWERLQNRPCRFLRSKEMFYDTGEPADDDADSGIFWCNRTHNCQGPDGLLVARQECGPHRECFEM